MIDQISAEYHGGEILADQCKIATYVWQDASSRSKRKGKEPRAVGHRIIR